jgi:hypothetical protein
MIPKSAVAVFGQDHAQIKQGSGAPKGALSNQYPRKARLRVAFQQRARLSALTLAALATSSTRWLSSRTGFPAGVCATGVLPVSP